MDRYRVRPLEDPRFAREFQNRYGSTSNTGIKNVQKPKNKSRKKTVCFSYFCFYPKDILSSFSLITYIATPPRNPYFTKMTNEEYCRRDKC
jgi:hypothetical protein